MGGENPGDSGRATSQWRLNEHPTVSPGRFSRRAGWLLWILFIGLQIADVVTTDFALAVPGNWEANPIMHFSQTHLGAAWWLPKIAVVGVAAGLTARTSRTWPILLVVSYYIIIVSSNLACL
jgi:hypothetical protein